jgi:hypothetical protein
MIAIMGLFKNMEIMKYKAREELNFEKQPLYELAIGGESYG